VVAEGSNALTLGAEVAPLTISLAAGPVSKIPCNSGCAQGLTCCQDVCVDLKQDVRDCGMCGHACSAQNATGVACVAGVCQAKCAPTFGDCTTPVAPVSDDGCEWNFNGCTDPNDECCGQCPPIVHSNGIPGETYQSCRPLGTPGMPSTYHVSMLRKAEAAYAPNVTPIEYTCKEANGQYCDALMTTKNGVCVMWCAADVVAGHLWISSSKACYCPDLSSSSNNATWN
jgi:hypothetical protein